MKFSKAAAELRRAARDICQQADKAEAETLKAAVAYAKRRSSGGRSTAQLSKIKPGAYSRKRGRPVYNPAIINAQSGEFRSKWRGVTVIVTRSRSKRRLINDSFKANLLDAGTRRMVARPIRQDIERFIARTRERNLRRRLRKYL